MDNTKENDWLSYVINNPDFSIDDFRSHGIESSNTTMGSVSDYEKNPAIQNMSMFQTEGKFDPVKFQDFYDKANARYNKIW